VRFQNDDNRPAVVLDDVAGVTFDHLNAQRATGAPLFVLRQVKGFAVRDSAGIADTQRPAAENETL
jgi:hypothetical protein